MAKFIVRRLLLMLLTMFLVSIAVFLITEAAPGNVARNVLGIHITPEQEASFLAQTGLDKPVYQRYFSWLVGTDWRAERQVGMPVKRITTQDRFTEWWAVKEDGTLIRWDMEGEDLVARRRMADGTVVEEPDNGRWQLKDPSAEIERLTAHRAQVQENAQLSKADQEAILKELDRILAVLGREDQPHAALLAALQEPEEKLETLVDPQAVQRKEALQTAAENAAREDRLLQALAVYQHLSEPASAELGANELQSMVRQLDRAAETLQDVNPALADQLRQAAGNLQAEEVGEAQEIMASAGVALDRLVSPLGAFVEAVRGGDYRLAVSTLNDLADSAQAAPDAERLAVLPVTLETVGKALERDVPEVGEPLLQAAASLRAGDLEQARAGVAQAAGALDEIGQAIARNDAARGSRVARMFWGIDAQNHAVRWEKGTGEVVWRLVAGSGWMAASGGPVEYIPLQKGLLRGDPGLSLRTARPVADLLFTRLRNSLVLAGIAFAIVMPLALMLGLLSGLNEGRPIDRALSIGGMMFSVTPEFATGIFLILIFAFWLKLVPGAAVFGEQAPWQRPEMLVLPVLTLTLVELGYVLRITRASMVEVMKAPYIRTAFLKGLPYRRIVFRHAVRNALMAPITVIMLHVNWLLGGIVVVEVIFGYPGLGSYLLDSALFKDFNAIEGGAMILVAVAVGTQLLADIIYTFLNPRIRYA